MRVGDRRNPTDLQSILSDDIGDALLEGSGALEILFVSQQKGLESRLQRFVVYRKLTLDVRIAAGVCAPDRLPAPVMPLCWSVAISSMSLSAARISGSSSAATAANSAGDMSAYSGGALVGSVPESAKVGVRYCACCSSVAQQSSLGIYDKSRDTSSHWLMNLRKASWVLATSFIRRWACSAARSRVSPRLSSGLRWCRPARDSCLAP